MAEAQKNIHATAVAHGQNGCLITGPSGSGKSALALQLMAYGCELVSDDQVEVLNRHGQLLARAPNAISGLIEARGVGILAAQSVSVARISFIVDMETVEDARFPSALQTQLLGVSVPLVHKVEMPHFPASVLQYLKGGRAK